MRPQRTRSFSECIPPPDAFQITAVRARLAPLSRRPIVGSRAVKFAQESVSVQAQSSLAALPDLLADDLDLVICGTAAGEKSAQSGAYYAQPGSQFWAVLRRVGLTPAQFDATDYRELLRWGIGLTDLAKTRSSVDTSIRRGDYDVDAFVAKIERYAPRVVAFNGKRAGRRLYMLSERQPIDCGRQQRGIGDGWVYVAAIDIGISSQVLGRAAVA